MFLFSLSALDIAQAKKSARGFVALQGQERLKALKQCSRTSPAYGFILWNPNERDIENFETDFSKCLQHDNLLPLEKYRRQYVGIFRGKQKIIYLNAVKKDFPSTNTIEQALVLCDGGDSSFGVEYDVNRKEFRSFEFNGPRSPASKTPVRNRCEESQPASDTNRKTK
jgi:hypothetical protein